MGNIMEKKGKEICFINSLLKAQTETTKTVNTNQWKRKQTTKGDKCDICSRTFTNIQGVNLHKKRVHGSGLMQLKMQRVATELKRSDSVKSANESSLPGSPSPKKVHIDIKTKVEKIVIVKTKKEEEMEQSGNTQERNSDQKVDMGVQCTYEE